MAGKVKWHGDEVRARIKAELERRIQTCCLMVWNRAKQLVNTDGTGVRQSSGGGRNAKGQFRKKNKGGLIYGANPSKPGDPPHKQRGRLLGSIAWEVAGLVGRVGSNLDYARWLELGTRMTAARPWLRVALAQLADAIRRIMSAPMKGP